MSDREKLNKLEYRYAKMKSNGKNSENSGIMRRMASEIRKLKQNLNE